jgi:hypothetical protein
MNTIKSLLQRGKIKEALVQFRALPEADQERFFREMAPTLFPPPIFGVLFRKLHPGETYKDFYKAWLPPLKEGQELAHYFPYPTYVLSGENKDDPSDIITIALMWVQEENLTEMLTTTKPTEDERHDKINAIAEKIRPTFIYKLKNVTQLGS